MSAMMSAMSQRNDQQCSITKKTVWYDGWGCHEPCKMTSEASWHAEWPPSPSVTALASHYISIPHALLLVSNKNLFQTTSTW